MSGVTKLLAKSAFDVIQHFCVKTQKYQASRGSTLSSVSDPTGAPVELSDVQDSHQASLFKRNEADLEQNDDFQT